MKKAISILLCLCLALSVFTFVPFAASAAETTQESVGDSRGWTGDCLWSLDNGGNLTISRNGAMGDYDATYSNGTLITTAPWGADIKTVVIEDGVTSIGKYAFYKCTGLTSVTIPDSVTSIGSSAFSGCTGLTSVHISDIAAWCKIAFTYDFCNPLYYAHNLYLNDVPVTDLIIPDSVTSIGDYAFDGCTGLTSVTIGNSVTSIGNDAFYGCTGLTSVTIGNSVTSIGYSAFYGCTGLTSVTIPDSVTSIGEWAFRDCTGLTSVTIPYSVTSIGWCAFIGCTGLTSITIPDSVTSIGDAAFYDCTGLTSVTIPNSVTSIGGSAFEYCTGLTSVMIPDSVTYIGDCAFGGCSGLTSIYVDENNSEYDSRNNCNAIINTSDNALVLGCKNTLIPDSVTRIGSSAFSGCTGLTGIIIPDSVTSIGSSAFSDCTGLTSIAIPDSVTSIDDSAFSNCKNLTIYGKDKSYAQTYAKRNRIPFVVGDICPHCYSVLKDDNIITDAGRPATCTDTGLTDGTHCSVCGEAIKAQEVIPALGHEKIEDIKFDATCTEDGVLYWHCSRCSELGEDAIPALGHDYKTVVTPLTCTQDGFTTHTCSHCGDKYVTNFTKAPGHSYSAVVTPPTCTQGGFTTHTCTKCGDVYVDSKIGALGHDFNVTVKREPTTSQQGVMTAECKKCDLKKNVLLPALSEQDYTITHGALTGAEAGKAIYTWKDNTYGSISFKTADTSVLFIGDIDRNGEIDIQDVTILQRHLAEYLNSDGSPIIDETNEEMLRIADINRDGIVSIADVTVIQRYLAEFPVEGELIIPKTKVSSITFSPTSLVMAKGQSQTLTVDITPSDAYNKELQWSSSDTAIATVDQTGKVTAKKTGTAIIYAAAKDGSGKQGSCSVLVSDPSATDSQYIEKFNKLVLNIRDNPTGIDGNGNPYISMSKSFQNGTQFFTITALPSGGLEFYHENSLDHSGLANSKSHVSFEANFNNSFMITLYFDYLATDSSINFSMGCSGSTSIDARNYSDNSTLYYSSLTQNENKTANTDTRLAFLDWDILLLDKYHTTYSMNNIGFKSYN